MSFIFGRDAVPQLPVPETQFWGSREGLCAAEAILFIAKGELTSVISCVQCGAQPQWLSHHMKHLLSVVLVCEPWASSLMV